MTVCIPLLPSFPNNKDLSAEKREERARERESAYSALDPSWELFPALRKESFEGNQKLKLRNQHDWILITKMKLCYWLKGTGNVWDWTKMSLRLVKSGKGKFNTVEWWPHSKTKIIGKYISRFQRHPVVCKYKEQGMKKPQRKLGQANRGRHGSSITVRCNRELPHGSCGQACQEPRLTSHRQVVGVC